MINYIVGCFLSVAFGLVIGSTIVKSVGGDEQVKVLNNTLENISALKKDCEKSLQRDKECVMVFEFVPVDNGAGGEG